LKKFSHRIGSRLLLGASLAALCVPSLALAQDEADEDQEGVIIVTGSRISGVAPVGATVTTLGREEIETGGQVTIDRMIQELPQVFDLGFSESSRAQSGGNGNATWSNSINLRGLSPFATLIILDGHRMTTNGRAISPSVLPTLGVERIEVIADGASAIYGSDAVAGVVNLIPRRSLDGVEAFGRIGSTGNGDFWEWNAGVALGKVFDRGQVMVAYEHAFRSNLSGDDRDFYTSDQTPFGGPDYRTTQCAPGTLTYGGVNYALPEQFTAANANSLTPNTSNRCDRLTGMDLFPEQEYDSVNGTLTYEFVDGVEFVFDGYYNRRDFSRAPGTNTLTFTVPETNAWFVAPNFYVPGSGGYRIAYNFENDIPQDLLTGYQSNWQVTPGLRVSLPADWTFNGRIGYGKAVDRADSSFGLGRGAGPLNAALASSDPATAFDPYGLGRTSATTIANVFSSEATFPTDAKLTTWQAGFDGPLFSLPGGDVKMAVGYEGQDFTMILGAGTNAVRTYNRTVQSGYAEVLLPIFGPGNATPGFEELELTAAVRYDHYDDIGQDTTNPKFGLNWVPADGMKFRGSYGTSFRAPTFPEIYGNSTALYIQPYQNPNGPGIVPGHTLGSGPNLDVGPETATTWTMGADFDVVDDLTLSLTYFNINFKDTISGLLSNLAVLTYADEYAGTDVILFGQAARDRILDVLNNGFEGSGGPLAPNSPRFGPSGAPPGALDCINGINIPNCVFVDGRSLNLGRTKMSGIDFNLRYRADVGPSDLLTFTASGTYLTNYAVAFTPGGDFVDLKNNIYQPLTFKARGSVNWDHGPFSTRLQVTHIGGYTNDIVTPNESVKSYTPIDLNLTWRIDESFDVGGIDGLTLGLEVRNLLNVDPPYVNSIPSANGGGGYDATVTDPIGRLFAVSLRSSF
jgi:iron complex outermembrane receptor protein